MNLNTLRRYGFLALAFGLLAGMIIGLLMLPTGTHSTTTTWWDKIFAAWGICAIFSAGMVAMGELTDLRAPVAEKFQYNDMVEDAAIALYEDSYGGKVPFAWTELSEKHREQWRHKARVAINNSFKIECPPPST
jgi:hypothetical protein